MFTIVSREHALIRPIENNIKTDGGIYIPNTSSKELTSFRGVVIALPEDRRNFQGVSVGDHVIFDKFGKEFELNGEKHILLHNHYINCLIINIKKEEKL